MPETHILLISAPLFGHIIPLLQFARKLVDHNHVVSFILSKAKWMQVQERALLPQDYLVRINFIGLNDDNDQDFEYADYNAAYRMEAPLEPCLRSLLRGEDCLPRDLSGISVASPKSSLHGNPVDFVVTDFNLTLPVYAAREANKPCFLFSAFSAKLLWHMLTIDDGLGSATVSDETLNFVRRINAAVPYSKGFLINSVREFDSEAVNRLDEVLDQFRLSAHFVGPLIPERTADLQRLEEWFDRQSTTSNRIIYVSFGSMVSLSQDQVLEIAKALQKTGHPAIWSLRLSSQEFLRTTLGEFSSDKIIVLQWVPQAAVLQHPNMGAFVTHCGWNSCLESIAYGVPLVCWPCMDDQHLNAQSVVRNGLGLLIPDTSRLDGRTVPADEICNAISCVLAGEQFASQAKMWKSVCATARSEQARFFDHFFVVP